MKALIFGGTTEGRRLAAALSEAGIAVTLSVATEFGRELAELSRAERRFPEGGGVRVLTGRLNREQIARLLIEGGFGRVIDATHPYAVLATENIRAACAETGVLYTRLKRPESGVFPGVTYAESAEKAAEILEINGGRALLTVGSKELHAFTRIKNYRERLFIRILPMEEALKKALELGFSGSNIICMQGPFKADMNEATLRATGANWLVTKDSGEPGGVSEKISAAEAAGCGVIVISRPFKEEGASLRDILEMFNITEPPKKEARKNSESAALFFPLFADIRGRKALVLGGGAVAERRIEKLLRFGAEITVISPAATERLMHLAAEGTLSLITREYRRGDIAEHAPFMVLAATNVREANHQAMTEAKELDIHISVADCRRECTFCFPAILENDSYIGGLMSKNGEHGALSEMAERIRGVLDR